MCENCVSQVTFVFNWVREGYSNFCLLLKTSPWEYRNSRRDNLNDLFSWYVNTALTIFAIMCAFSLSIPLIFSTLALRRQDSIVWKNGLSWDGVTPHMMWGHCWTESTRVTGRLMTTLPKRSGKRSIILLMQADKGICSLHVIKMNNFITPYYSPFGVKVQSKLFIIHSWQSYDCSWISHPQIIRLGLTYWQPRLTLQFKQDFQLDFKSFLSSNLLSLALFLTIGYNCSIRLSSER